MKIEILIKKDQKGLAYFSSHRRNFGPSRVRVPAWTPVISNPQQDCITKHHMDNGSIWETFVKHYNTKLHLKMPLKALLWKKTKNKTLYQPYPETVSMSVMHPWWTITQWKCELWADESAFWISFGRNGCYVFQSKDKKDHLD